MTGSKLLYSMAMAVALAQIQPSHAAAQDDDGEPPPPPPVPTGCIRIGQTVSCPTTPQEAAAALIAGGPNVFVGPDLTRFQVSGFVRDGWPFVADFESQPGTRTVLRIRLFSESFFGAGREVLSIPIDHEGAGVRQLFHLEALELQRQGLVAPEELRVATFEIESHFIKPDGKLSKERAPVIVYGVGAGPAAVGSVAISEVALVPPSFALRIPQNRKDELRVPFRFRLKRSFPLVSIHVRNDCRRLFCRSVAYGPQPAAASSGIFTGTWPLKGKSRPGNYRLFVRAWLLCDGRTYPDCGDDAAWVTGFSPLATISP